jgi:hypothetical protein
MKEAKWLTCDDPEQMIGRVWPAASNRKLRLFACACCYRVYNEKSNGRELASVAIAERFADGVATVEELQQAEEAMDRGDYRSGPGDYVSHQEIWTLLEVPQAAAWLVEYNGVYRGAEPGVLKRQERLGQTQLLRDIFGNPFRPITLDRVWLTSTVTALAVQMYESRDFGAMPILADALQDAGCDSEDVLNHCRGPGPHVRGCWVVDLVLGKS